MSETITISLKDQSEQLLNPTCTFEQMAQAIRNVHDLFKENTGLAANDHDIQRAAAITTAYGKALGLSHAAACLVDGYRTRQFLRGLVSAIRKKQEDNPGEKIKIYYAGCGPYAPFVTLVAPLFKPDEVGFSILDINPEALNLAQSLIKKLGYQDFVEDVQLADATIHNVPNADQYHILFSETLDALLNRECYVPILHNLIPQFPKDVIIVPENVQVKLTFLRTEEGGKEIEAESEIVLDARQLVSSLPEGASLPDFFTPHNVTFNKDENISAIVLDTIVQTYGGHDLIRGESQLTEPRAFKIEKDVNFDTLSFIYRIQPQIELFVDTLNSKSK